MLFGRKEEFAIEAMVEPGLTAPSSVWGRMRIWCKGFPLGDFDNPHCGLPDDDLQVLGAKVQDLWHPSFEGLDDAGLFHHLDRLLFGCRNGEPFPDSRSLEECRADAHAFIRFGFLTNWGEMFDSTGKCFVVCSDGHRVKVLHQPESTTGCITFEFSVESIKTTCAQFGTWFSEQSTRLR